MIISISMFTGHVTVAIKHQWFLLETVINWDTWENAANCVFKTTGFGRVRRTILCRHSPSGIFPEPAPRPSSTPCGQVSVTGQVDLPWFLLRHHSFIWSSWFGVVWTPLQFWAGKQTQVGWSGVQPSFITPVFGSPPIYPHAPSIYHQI